jgi:EamA domain-containing membrane protein RarD
MNIEHSLKQYKIYLDMIERISDRRMVTHNFFISIITAVITLIVVLASSDVFASNKGFILSFLCAFVFGICKIWIDSLGSFAKLNSAKFKILFQIEKDLPYKCLMDEWELLKNDSSYRLLSENEKRVPKYIMAFMAVSAVAYLLYVHYAGS